MTIITVLAFELQKRNEQKQWGYFQFMSSSEGLSQETTHTSAVVPIEDQALQVKGGSDGLASPQCHHDLITRVRCSAWLPGADDPGRYVTHRGSVLLPSTSSEEYESVYHQGTSYRSAFSPSTKMQSIRIAPSATARTYMIFFLLSIAKGRTEPRSPLSLAQKSRFRKVRRILTSSLFGYTYS